VVITSDKETKKSRIWNGIRIPRKIKLTVAFLDIDQDKILGCVQYKIMNKREEKQNLKTPHYI